MKMVDLLISVGTEYDGKALSKAQSQTSNLEKQTNKLAKALIAAFSVKKIADYSKASVKAFAEDQKSAALLTNQLKNLGLGYQSIPVEKFIASLEQQTGILDDQLRPAFAQLVRVTGSVAESQKLMQVAFDTSRGAGVDYMEAVDAISKAYVGNLKGLKKLNLGLTDAQLKTMKFEDIVKKLNDQFGGAGQASVNTYAGKIDRLNVATSNAQETIGKGFVDAFSLIANDSDFNKVIKSIDDMALSVSNALVGVGVIIDRIKNTYSGMPSWVKAAVELYTKIGTTTFGTTAFKYLEKVGSKQQIQKSMPQGAALFLQEQIGKSSGKSLTIAKQTTKELSKQTAEKKAQLAIDKANQALGLAKNVFDLERISVAAAMANTTLTENERKRLEIKQAIFSLEDAIDSKDTARIDAATKILNGLVGQFSILQAQDSLLDKIKSAYDSLGMNKDLINLNNLQSAYDLLLKMAGIKIGGFTATGGGNIILNPPGGGGGITAGSTFDPGSFRWRDEGNTGNMPTLPSAIGATWDPAAFRRGEMGQPPIVIKVESKANDLVNFIYDTVTEASASGAPPIVSRIGTNLAW